MTTQVLKFKKLHKNAERPIKAHPSDAGYDVVATSAIKIDSGLYEYSTGIALAIPEGHFVALFPRSSITKTGAFLANSVGVLDPNYRGEVKVRFYASSAPYGVGERIAQLVLLPLPAVRLEEVSSLDETDRGTGGFGSTGK